MALLRRVRVLTRLSAGFAAVALCVCGLWLVAMSSASGTRATNTSLSQALARVEAAQQLKYRSADFNGWQTAYAFKATLPPRSRPSTKSSR
jgi:methyl-accepting chemotaxis protein